jgi:hypothetical protein
MFFCIPDCVNNPLHQFLPKDVNNPLATGIDESWALWGIDPWDPEIFCDAMWGDLLRGKEGVDSSYWSAKNIGLGLDSCDMSPKTKLTDWVMGWNAGFLAMYTGNTICCHLCGTCQTEKFRCNMVADDDDRGAYPCGSDAWGFVTATVKNKCMTGDPSY